MCEYSCCWKRRWNGLAAIGSSLTAFMTAWAVAHCANDTVVARVADKVIHSSEIRLSMSAGDSGSGLTKAIGMASYDSSFLGEELSRAELQTAIGALAARIEQIIYLSMLSTYGISVSEGETAARLNLVHGSADSVGIAETARLRKGRLLEALEEVRELGLSAESAYVHHLTQDMSFDAWSRELISYDDPGRRAMLSRLVSFMEEEDGSSVAESARRWVRYEKLNKIIDDEIAEENKEYRTFLEHRQQGRWPEKYSPHYDDLMRKEWWREQYRKADIEIMDNRFEGALRLLLEDPE
jgi:hypothetical protein